MGKPFKFWVTLSVGIILGIIFSCFLALGLFLLEWNRKTVSNNNTIVKAISTSGINSGQTKVLELDQLSDDMTREDVSAFMKSHKFNHSGSRIAVDNLGSINQPTGYTEIYEANVGHPLCSFKYLVITYYDESSYFTKAIGRTQSNGCV